MFDPANNKNVRLTSLLLSLGLGFLLLLSIVYWKERVFILDASFQSFSLVASEDWAIQVQRYGAILVQSLPLLLVKLQAPLWVVLLSYSVSFTLYPILFFFLLTKLDKPRIAWALALFFLLIMAHTFFWIQSELIQATALAILTIGVSQQADGWHWPKAFWGLLLSVVVIYAHPLGIAPLTFGWMFLGVHEVRVRDGKARMYRYEWHKITPYLFLTLTAIAFFVLKQFYLGTGEYDQTAVDMIENLPAHIGEIFTLPATNRFLLKCLTHYQTIPLLFFGLMYWYIRTKDWPKIAIVHGAVLLWLTIILCTWWYGAEQFYIESYYLMLGCFLGLPLAFDVIPRLNRLQLMGLLSFILLLRLSHIVVAGQEFKDRRVYIERLVEEMQERPNQRYTVYRDSLDMEKLQMDWGLPYATLMMSAVKNPDLPRTLLAYTGEHPPEHVEVFQKSGFATPWGPFKYEWLANDRYFRLSDTTRVETLDPVFLLGQ